jgi:hypothetical protein
LTSHVVHPFLRFFPLTPRVHLPFCGRPSAGRMFPYPSRFRWFFHGPADHLLMALARRPAVLEHPLVKARAAQMRRYLGLRVVAAALLYVGILATSLGWLARYLPGLTQEGLDRLTETAATLGALTSVVSLAYLLLTRLVLQCQMDILGHFMIGMPEGESSA